MEPEDMYADYVQAKMVVSYLQKKLERKTNQANHLGKGHKKLCRIQEELDTAQEVKQDCLAKITENRTTG